MLILHACRLLRTLPANTNICMTFVQCWTRLGRRCTNGIQMSRVCWDMSYRHMLQLPWIAFGSLIKATQSG